MIWNTTPDECKPYLKFWERQILFREVVIGFIGGGQIEKENKGKNIKNKIGHYCNGKDVVECKSYFGDELVNICMTCPQ